MPWQRHVLSECPLYNCLNESQGTKKCVSTQARIQHKGLRNINFCGF